MALYIKCGTFNLLVKTLLLQNFLSNKILLVYYVKHNQYLENQSQHSSSKILH